MTSKTQRLRFHPFAYALFSEELSNYCWYCLTSDEIKKRCLGCELAVFCGKTCQSLGWKDHKAECRGLRKAVSVPDIETRMLGRIVLRYKEICSGKDKRTDDFYKDRTSKRTILEIWSHSEKILNDTFAMNKFEGIYERLLQFYEKKFMLPKETVFQLHCRDYINRHAISDKAYMKEIGKGLYLDLCAYDHSCRPNAIYTCDGFVATLRGLNSNIDLEDKNSTFYAYIDLLNSTQQRRKELKDSWYFDCFCDRCTDPTDNLLTSVLCPNCPCDDQQALNVFEEHSYRNNKSRVITCPKCCVDVPKAYVMEALSAMKFIEKIIEDKEVEQMPEITRVKFLEDLLERFSKILSGTNIYLCKVIQNLIPLIPSSNTDKLLQLHIKAENCVRLCFPHNHPALAFHLRSIGTFLKKRGRYEEALKYLREAMEIMEFSLDTDHLMTIECRALFEQTLEDISLTAQEEKKLLPPMDASTVGETSIVMESSTDLESLRGFLSTFREKAKFPHHFSDDLSDLPELLL